jgi:hypothetical protein
MTYIWKNVTGKYNVRENGYLTALWTFLYI